MQIAIPEYCLVVLIGASGAGKSHFAARHFAPSEVLSSDSCRALVRDDPNDQAATNDAFEVLRFIAAKRLAARRLTVVDAINVRPEDRRDFVALAREYHALAVALVFDLPEAVCHERNAARQDRSFGPHVARSHIRALRRSIKRLRREGFRYQFRFGSEEEANAAAIERRRLWTDRRDEPGPFDIIGDVHGCFDELRALLDKLGYQVACSAGPDGDRYQVRHPQGRRLAFLGDLVDRGPRGREYLRIIYGPEYTAPEHLARLRERGLSAKRSLALREHALGLEGLQRFVEREPLRRVHECAFAVLALESEPVDPRL